MCMINVEKGKPGLAAKGFFKLSDPDYFARPEMSNSDLSKVFISPLAYKHYKANPSLYYKTESMALGSLVHCMYLEPELVTKQFVEQIAVDKRTKVGKEKHNDFLKENAGKTVVPPEQWEKANTMVCTVQERLGLIEKLAGDGHAELALFFEYQGVRCKGKMDYLSNLYTIWDLKTTKSLIQFEKSIANFGYHRQGAFYGKGLSSLTGKFKGFYFIVVESEPPFDCAVFTLDLPALKRGVSEVDLALEDYKKAVATNVWPGQHQDSGYRPVPISLPRWY